MEADSVAESVSHDLLEPIKPTKRSRCTNAIRKLKRNSGQSYENSSGKIVEARRLKPLEQCRSKCRERISEEQQLQLFTEYWQLKSRSKRQIYLANLINIIPKKCTKINAQRIRNCNFSYSVKIDDEHTIPVCSGCFVTIFAENKGFVNVLCSKLANNIDVTSDNRGGRRSKIFLQQQKTELIDQIDKFELVVCQTCGECGNYRYIPKGTNILDMFRDYCNESTHPVSMVKYKKFMASNNVKLKHFLTCESCKLNKEQLEGPADGYVKLEIEKIQPNLKEEVFFVDMVDWNATPRSEKPAKIPKKDQVTARKMEPLPTCRRNCRNLVTPDQRKTIFDEYWNLVTYKARKSYLCNLITMENTKQCTINAKRMRNYTFFYKIYVQTEAIQLCKVCFLVMFGEKPNFVNHILMKKSKMYDESEIVFDRRGGSNNTKSIGQTEELDKHFNKFVTYKAVGNSNASCHRYFSENLSLVKMFEAYKSECENHGLHKPVSLTTYKKAVEAKNWRFFKKNSTCVKCCRLKRLTEKVDGADNEIFYQCEMEEHTQRVKDATLEFHTDQQNPDSTVLHLYMPSYWPAPLSNKPTPLYLSKLWTFSLIIKNYRTGTTTCYIWDETVAYRGASELASCLYNYLTNTAFETSNVIVYSTSLNGLAKDPIFSGMYNKFLLDHDHIDTLEHKFQETGHISDSNILVDAAKVEKVQKKSLMSVSHPYDWRQIAKSCEFALVNMTREHFFNFGLYRKQNLQKRAVISGTDNDEIVWKKVRTVMYRRNEFGVLYIKEAFADCVFIRAENKQPFGRSRKCTNALEPLHDHPLPISSKKYADLMEQLTQVDEVFWDFYQSLEVDESAEDLNPDIYFSDEAEDNDDEYDTLSD